MKKNLWMNGALVMMAALALTGCKTSEKETEKTSETVEATESAEKSELAAAEVQVFVANSLNDAILELTDAFNETYPDIKIVPNALGSQELRQQIESGMSCDLFISANMSQMTALDENQEKDYVVDDSMIRLLTNELVLITGKDSGTSVTSFETIPSCKGVFALAGEDVPVGN